MGPYTDEGDTTFIEALERDDAITDPLIGILISGSELILDIGAIEPDAMSPGDDLTFIPSNYGSEFWSADITHVRTSYDDYLSYSYGFEPIQARLSTKFEVIGLPNTIYNSVVALILAGQEDYFWDAEAQNIVVDEDGFELLPTLEFNLGGYWVQILPEDYMVYEPEAETYSSILYDTTSLTDDIILGTPFLTGYYTVFVLGDSYRFNTIGLGPEDGSSKLVLEPYEEDEEYWEELPETSGDVLGDRDYLEDIEDGEDSAYYLNGALVISSLMALALF